jgi:hypothetical protein
MKTAKVFAASLLLSAACCAESVRGLEGLEGFSQKPKAGWGSWTSWASAKASSALSYAVTEGSKVASSAASYGSSAASSALSYVMAKGPEVASRAGSLAANASLQGAALAYDGILNAASAASNAASAASSAASNAASEIASVLGNTVHGVAGGVGKVASALGSAAYKAGTGLGDAAYGMYSGAQWVRRNVSLSGVDLLEGVTYGGLRKEYDNFMSQPSSVDLTPVKDVIAGFVGAIREDGLLMEDVTAYASAEILKRLTVYGLEKGQVASWATGQLIGNFTYEAFVDTLGTPLASKFMGDLPSLYAECKQIRDFVVGFRELYDQVKKANDFSSANLTIAPAKVINLINTLLTIVDSNKAKEVVGRKISQLASQTMTSLKEVDSSVAVAALVPVTMGSVFARGTFDKTFNSFTRIIGEAAKIHAPQSEALLSSPVAKAASSVLNLAYSQKKPIGSAATATNSSGYAKETIGAFGKTLDVLEGSKRGYVWGVTRATGALFSWTGIERLAAEAAVYCAGSLFDTAGHKMGFAVANSLYSEGPFKPENPAQAGGYLAAKALASLSRNGTEKTLELAASVMRQVA